MINTQHWIKAWVVNLWQRQWQAWIRSRLTYRVWLSHSVSHITSACLFPGSEAIAPKPYVWKCTSEWHNSILWTQWVGNLSKRVATTKVNNSRVSRLETGKLGWSLCVWVGVWCVSGCCPPEKLHSEVYASQIPSSWKCLQIKYICRPGFHLHNLFCIKIAAVCFIELFFFKARNNYWWKWRKVHSTENWDLLVRRSLRSNVRLWSSVARCSVPACFLTFANLNWAWQK